jgi:hypothetical protein
LRMCTHYLVTGIKNVHTTYQQRTN